MTLSEFIKTYALQAYFDYCRRNQLTPKVDVVPEPTVKLCALVKRKTNEQTSVQTKPKPNSSIQRQHNA